MTIRHLWQKRRSIIFTWLISYSVVLIVPILISLVVYWQSSKALASEIHRANDSLLKQVRYTIDSQIDLMKRLNMELTWNAMLQSLMYSSMSEGNAQYNAYKLVKDFRMYQTSYASIDEFYVTWEREDAVLRAGNVRDRQTAFRTLHDNGELTYGEWLALVDGSRHNQFIVLPHLDSSEPNTSIAYITRLPKDLNGRDTGSVVVMADTVRFQAAIESISGFSGGQLLILNRDNEVLLSNLPVQADERYILARVSEGAGTMLSGTKDGDAEIFYLQSAVSDLKYALVIPSGIYWEKAVYVRQFTYASILISVIGAGVLTWFFLRRNYSPIQELVRSLADKSGGEDPQDGNELRFIERAILNTRSEKESIALQLRMHQHVLRSNMLNRLMKGKPDSPIPYEEAFRSYNMKLLSDRFAVILFVVENDERLTESMPGIDINETRRLIHFIITNVVEEMVGHYRHAGYVAEVDDMMVCLVNPAEPDDARCREELRSIAREAQRFLMRFHMDLTVSIGGLHTGLAGIAAAYREAVDAMEYKMVLGKKGIIAYDDIRLDPDDHAPFGFDYSLQAEQRLINLIKAGEFEQASAFMRDITDRNFNRPIMSLTLARCLIFNLAGTMLKAVNELGGDRSALGDNPLWIDRIVACDTVGEMRGELLSLLREVCAFAAARLASNMTRERAESLRELMERVVRHIRDNYHDANLNVNLIGERFDLKGSYLSKLFRSYTGEGLLDYIHKCRIETAKRMMRSKDESIADISRLVGYNDAATFIRVFKKYEGITPGKYKEIG